MSKPSEESMKEANDLAFKIFGEFSPIEYGDRIDRSVAQGHHKTKIISTTKLLAEAIDKYKAEIAKLKMQTCDHINGPFLKLKDENEALKAQVKEKDEEIKRWELAFVRQGETLGEMLIVANTDKETLKAEIEENYGYASRLFKSAWPQCEPLSDLSGVLTQIDNGLTDFGKTAKENSEIYSLKSKLQKAREALHFIIFNIGATGSIHQEEFNLQVKLQRKAKEVLEQIADDSSLTDRSTGEAE